MLFKFGRSAVPKYSNSKDYNGCHCPFLGEIYAFKIKRSAVPPILTYHGYNHIPLKIAVPAFRPFFYPFLGEICAFKIKRSAVPPILTYLLNSLLEHGQM